MLTANRIREMRGEAVVHDEKQWDALAQEYDRLEKEIRSRG
jgi:hypothetical protein